MRGYPALFCELDPSKRSKPVQLSLLQEARAKPARQQVKSERPGLPAGAFAFCGVRTTFCDQGYVRGGLRPRERARGARGDDDEGAVIEMHGRRYRQVSGHDSRTETAST
jgi:hypothetical protein